MIECVHFILRMGDFWSFGSGSEGDGTDRSDVFGEDEDLPPTTGPPGGSSQPETPDGDARVPLAWMPGRVGGHGHPGSSPPGVVMRLFSGMTGVAPTTAGWCALKKLFPCTGKPTRSERRNKRELVAAFEAHAPEILAQMERPEMQEQVMRILQASNKKPGDRRRMWEVGIPYLDAHGLPRSCTAAWGPPPV
jgi:hypothetical protein